MVEMKSVLRDEVSKPNFVEKKSFDPDKRIDISQKEDTKDLSGYNADKRLYSSEAGTQTDKYEDFKADTGQKETSLNETKEKGEPIANKKAGLERENQFYDQLLKDFSEKDGYKIYSECPLRDSNGNLAKDEKTGEGRRLDFVVAKDGKIVNLFEVTSEKESKIEQMAKEYRIRESGGNYIRDDNGNLLKIPDNVNNEIVRLK